MMDELLISGLELPPSLPGTGASEMTNRTLVAFSGAAIAVLSTVGFAPHPSGPIPCLDGSSVELGQWCPVPTVNCANGTQVFLGQFCPVGPLPKQTQQPIPTPAPTATPPNPGSSGSGSSGSGSSGSGPTPCGGPFNPCG